MNTQLFKTTILFYILVTSLTAHAVQHSQGSNCPRLLHILSTALYKRGHDRPTLDLTDKTSYMKESQYMEALGRVRSIFRKDWDTRVYYAATASPDRSGNIPLVDPQSKEVFLYLHGSGTMKGSGKNFYGQMNVMADMGYSGIGIDLPFHAEGTLDSRMYNTKYFMNYIHKIVEELLESKKPVNIVGHSFGSLVAAEFASRYPEKIKSGQVKILAMSLVAYEPAMMPWVNRVMPKMKFHKDTLSNQAAGEWADQVSRGFVFNKNILPDPTLTAPDESIIFALGDHEEYLQAPLKGRGRLVAGPNTFDIESSYRKFFKNVTVIFAKKAGHGVFKHKDENGNSTVTKWLLRIAGQNIENENAIRSTVGRERDSRSLIERLAHEYATNRIFQTWADQTYGPKKILRWSEQDDSFMAKKVHEEYFEFIQKYENSIYEDIIHTKVTHPYFYSRYSSSIEALKKKKDRSLFLPYYVEVLRGSDDNSEE